MLDTLVVSATVEDATDAIADFLCGDMNIAPEAPPIVVPSWVCARVKCKSCGYSAMAVGQFDIVLCELECPRCDMTNFDLEVTS